MEQGQHFGKSFKRFRFLRTAWKTIEKALTNINKSWKEFLAFFMDASARTFSFMV